MFIILSCDQASDQHNSNLKPNDDVALLRLEHLYSNFVVHQLQEQHVLGHQPEIVHHSLGVVFPGRLQLWITVKPFVLTKILPSTFIIHIPLTQLGLLYHARLI